MGSLCGVPLAWNMSCWTWVEPVYSGHAYNFLRVAIIDRFRCTKLTLNAISLCTSTLLNHLIMCRSQNLTEFLNSVFIFLFRALYWSVYNQKIFFYLSILKLKLKPYTNGDTSTIFTLVYSVGVMLLLIKTSDKALLFKHALLALSTWHNIGWDYTHMIHFEMTL